MKNIVYFFGAGAEAVFNTPLGNNYTKETALVKRTSLYECLDDFYKKRGESNYIKEFMFREKSEALFEEYKRTVLRMTESSEWKPDERNLFWGHKNTFESEEKKERDNSERIKEIREAFRKEYEKIVSEKYKPEDPYSNIEEPYKSIIKEFSFFGAIERDFSCIIDPERMGPKRFWRLINYFWGAFFSILIPILDHYDGYSQYLPYRSKSNKDKYSFVLQNLDEVLNTVENINPDETSFKCDEKYINYYSALKDGFSNSDITIKAAMTTNYTPFVRRYFEDKAIYLAGELRMFEEIKTMHVAPYSECIGGVFPFMQTQAVVKPIISKYQMEQYSKAISALEGGTGEENYLVVIGFSFCENDSHIMGIVRDSLLDGGIKKIVYYKYCEDPGKFNKNEETQKVLKALRLVDEKKLLAHIEVRPIPKKEDICRDVQDTIASI